MFNLGLIVTNGYDHDGNDHVTTDHQTRCWNYSWEFTILPLCKGKRANLDWCGLLKVKALPQRHTFSNRATPPSSQTFLPSGDQVLKHMNL